MDLSQILTLGGLAIDIVGAVLLYRYGLPSRFPHGSLLLLDGDQVVTAEWGSESHEEFDEINSKQQRFERFSRLGLRLLIFGFVLQLLGALH